MSHLINVSNELYDQLTRMKKAKNTSYTELIKELIGAAQKEEKTEKKEDFLAYINQLENKYKRKPKEDISGNIEKILYGSG